MKRLLASVVLAGVSVTAYAGSRDQAKRLHDRLAGVPPSAAVLDQMATLIENGQAEEAAMIPINSEFFYRITLRNMVSRWTNADETLDVPLNDYTATIIGLIRDDQSFDQVLSGDVLYTGPDALQATTAYDPSNDNHYAAFEAEGYSYMDDLTQRQQTTLSGLPVAAGIMTTRGWGDLSYNAGTNRRAIRFSMKTFLCRDLEQLSDLNVPDGFVRRDVDRIPGGDPRAYRNKCAGCHAGMDPLSKAFAHFDFVDGAVTYTPEAIPEKINRNGDTFALGYVTEDDSWSNLWVTGQNANVGWGGVEGGTGPVAYGQMITGTDAFPTCMAERVFTKVCLRSPGDDDQADIAELASDFAGNGFNMKGLFRDASVKCMGE